MKKVLILLIVLLNLSLISGVCEGGQIDINSASLNELDKLTGIGPVKAEAIINSRVFESVDDLIDVWGIGDATLNKIKEQGLACVDKEEIEEEKEIKNPESESTEEITHEPEEEKETINTGLNIIELHPKDINTETDKENLDKSNYAIYGFVAFCVLLGVLLMLRRKKYKNEFE